MSAAAGTWPGGWVGLATAGQDAEPAADAAPFDVVDTALAWISMIDPLMPSLYLAQDILAGPVGIFGWTDCNVARIAFDTVRAAGIDAWGLDMWAWSAPNGGHTVFSVRYADVGAARAALNRAGFHV